MNTWFGKGKLDSISDRGGVMNPFHNSILTAVLLSWVYWQNNGAWFNCEVKAQFTRLSIFLGHFLLCKYLNDSGMCNTS